MGTLNTTTAATAQQQVPLVLATVFVAYLGQFTLNPIIAPLAREVGLAEWQIGVTIGAAALMLVGTSQFWGRRSQSWGRKPVLTGALALGTVTMIMFTLVAILGMRGMIAGTWLFVLFVLLRGLGFGVAISAVPPTAQAYIADVTEPGKQRVAWLSGLGAAQGIAMVGGAALGGGLSAFGLATALIAVPVVLSIGLLLVIIKLRREPATTLIEKPVRPRVSDGRIWPYLVAGFGLYTALGFIQVATGFIVIDRFGLDPQAAGPLTGGALIAAGVGVIVAQSVIVPRTGWRPGILLRVGSAAALAGYLIMIPDAGPVVLIASMLIIGLGLGIAGPGYLAGPTMAMRREEQGGLAGLLSANLGLTFVIAPLAGTTLYGLQPALPIIASAVIMAAVTVFVAVHPRFRRTDTDPCRDLS
ncbi:MFS transporter [Microlunatus parietis]|uniref:MFS family permease n=1 Tax=Microlunatus parietis TaxID=682979 RepID=A0A7Y9LBG4_9ACTN|nr:MFS transporter [Microlunatus parietis]NYE69811.1 MFS family permease [Microlunatus parietis]